MSRINVAYVSASGTEMIFRDISATPYRFETFPSKETILRVAIDRATGRNAAVLQDLYRGLVLSNFAKLDGKGGKSAKGKLDELYPVRGTLPEFRFVSGRFNATGAIYYNIEIHQAIQDGYELLPSFLLGLLNAGFDPPRCEPFETASRPAETSAKPPSAASEEPPEYLPMG